MDEAGVLCVPPDAVEALWPAIWPTIAQAYDEVDEVMPPEMLEELKAGRLLLWLSAPDGKILGLLITALFRKPSGLVCKLVVCCGERMKVWLDEGHRKVEAYARAEGCGKMQVDGRRGWARYLRDYEVKRVVLEKVL